MNMSCIFFNHRTSETSKFKSPVQSHIAGHMLQDQEVEYILYGLSSCSANKAAAYAEVYMIRFAIRMLEALMDVRKAASNSYFK